MDLRFHSIGLTGKNNENRRAGKFKDSEFDIQTGWYVDGQPASGMADEPVKTLQGSGLQPGQTVLEVGCGTGFFTTIFPAFFLFIYISGQLFAPMHRDPNSQGRQLLHKCSARTPTGRPRVRRLFAQLRKTV